MPEEVINYRAIAEMMQANITADKWAIKSLMAADQEITRLRAQIAELEQRLQDLIQEVNNGKQ